MLLLFFYWTQTMQSFHYFCVILYIKFLYVNWEQKIKNRLKIKFKNCLEILHLFIRRVDDFVFEITFRLQNGKYTKNYNKVQFCLFPLWFFFVVSLYIICSRKIFGVDFYIFCKKNLKRRLLFEKSGI